MTNIDHRVTSMRYAADSSTVTITCACGWHRAVKRTEPAIIGAAGPDPAATTERMSRTAFADHEHHRNTSAVR